MEQLAAIVIGGLLTRYIEKMKKAGFDSLLSLAILSGIVGLLYTGYNWLVPFAFQENVVSFVSQASLSAVVIHETLKRIQSK